MTHSPAAADLAAQLPLFAARLRLQHGFLIGPGEVADSLRALSAVDVLNVREVKDALRAVLSATPEQGHIFDAEFELFFRRSELPPPELPPLLPQAPGGEPEASPAQDSKKGQPKPTPENAQIQGNEAEEEGSTTGQPQGEGQEGDSPDAPQTLLTRLSPNAGEGGAFQAVGDDLPTLLRAAGALVQAIRLGHSRRLVPRPCGLKLDARRTIRAAARTAGDPLYLRWLGRPQRSPRFLMVLDGSRSMGQDATRLLRFAYALHLRSRRVEVYVFSTGLTRLTPLLRAAKPSQPLALPELGEAWGGGTRIGENLLKLARDERAHVNQDTVVLILSDGLDTGEPELMRRAMRELSGRCGLLVWLSPLAGLPHYQPVQRAVAAALPYLDALLPAGNVADLLRLPGLLRRL